MYIRINGMHVKMQVDMGEAFSMISERLYHRRFYKIKLFPASCVLKMYSIEG